MVASVLLPAVVTTNNSYKSVLYIMYIVFLQCYYVYIYYISFLYYNIIGACGDSVAGCVSAKF